MFALAMLVATVACSGTEGLLDPADEVVDLQLMPGDITLTVGNSVYLTATGHTADGTPVDGDVIWTSSDPTIASVTDAGLVTALTVGEASVEADFRGKGKAHGRQKKSSKVKVEDPPTPQIPPGEDPLPPPPSDTIPPPPPGDGIPFGPSRFDVTSDYPFNASLYHRVHAGREESELSQLVANDKRASVNMVGGKGNYKNPDETFNVDMWKAELDEFDVEIVQKYVDNGTIVAHYALDEPHAGSQWSGDDVDPALVDEAACYSKSKWPNLPVLIRTHPGWAVREEGAAHDFQCVDIWVAQYSSRKGPIDEYVAQNVADAAALGAQLYGALNPITGGDGSSGVASPVWDGKWMMSADEVRTYGEAWMNAPIAGFSAWYWGWGVPDPMDWYWSQPDIRAAVDYLVSIKP